MCGQSKQGKRRMPAQKGRKINLYNTLGRYINEQYNINFLF